MVATAATVTPVLWRVVGASVRGAAHVREDIPNQDGLAMSDVGSGAAVALAAVADGHGGARHFRSDTGAQLAVAGSIEVLQGFAQSLAAGLDANAIMQRARVELPTLLTSAWRKRVVRHLQGSPITEREWRTLLDVEGEQAMLSVQADNLLAYGATLLVAMTLPQGIVLLQLGDGDILAIDRSGGTRRPVPADARLQGSTTTSLCQPDAPESFRLAFIAPDQLPSLLMLATDGYANSFRTDADFLLVGRDLLDLIRTEGLNAVSGRLPEFLAEASGSGSGDDITVALLARDPTTTTSMVLGKAGVEVLAPTPGPAVPGTPEAVGKDEPPRAAIHRWVWVVAAFVLITLGLLAWRYAPTGARPGPADPLRPAEAEATMPAKGGAPKGRANNPPVQGQASGQAPGPMAGQAPGQFPGQQPAGLALIEASVLDDSIRAGHTLSLQVLWRDPGGELVALEIQTIRSAGQTPRTLQVFRQELVHENTRDQRTIVQFVPIEKGPMAISVALIDRAGKVRASREVGFVVKSANAQGGAGR